MLGGRFAQIKSVTYNEVFMHFEPLIIGVLSFLIIGIFHPIVIKTEFYFSYKAWPVFLVIGIIICSVSVIHYWNTIINTALAIIGFSSLWAIGELIEQRDRVLKGWFPKNPKRKIPYEKLEIKDSKDNNE